MRRLLLTTTTITLLSAAPAAAHVTVEKTAPGAGKTASTRVSVASVTFTGPIQSGTLRVTGPGGARASADAGGRDPRSVKRILVELRGGLKAGRYRASWTMVAGDGHRQKGSFRFRLKR